MRRALRCTSTEAKLRAATRTGGAAGAAGAGCPCAPARRAPIAVAAPSTAKKGTRGIFEAPSSGSDATKPRQPATGHRDFLMGLSGVEPLTSRLSGVRSNHLSYRPSPPPHPSPFHDATTPRRKSDPSRLFV